MAGTVVELEAERDALLRELAAPGDMRRGSLTEVFRRCGKEACRCSDASHPGHGPYYAYTRKVAGKTKTLQLRGGPLAEKIGREVKAAHQFRATCDKLLDVSEALCDARPVEGGSNAASTEAAKKGGSKQPSRPRSSPRSRRS